MTNNLHTIKWLQEFQSKINIALSAGAVKYTDCISVERQYPTNEWPGYEIKPSDGKAPVVLELWEMQGTPTLPSLSGPLLPRPEKVLSMRQIELFDI